MAKHLVKCLYCGQQFDANQEPFVQLQRRYAHKECADKEALRQARERSNEQILEDYIKYLYQTETLDPKIQKQIQKLINDKTANYTYSGIQKALEYFYEIKKNPIDRRNPTIGIISWVYNEAKQYYYSLWLAQQKNRDKDISSYVPDVREVVIKPPQRKTKRRKLFSFLDREDTT